MRSLFLAAHAIEAAGMLRPLRVAERGRAGGNRVGLQRLPIGLEEVGASFHHHGLSVGPLNQGLVSKVMPPSNSMSVKAQRGLLPRWDNTPLALPDCLTFLT